MDESQAQRRGDATRLMQMPSSVIRTWRYDVERGRLDVTFTSGRRYCYLDVPEAVAAGLAAAGSKGSYFNRQIRDRFAFEPAD